ncbi:MAG: 1-(5-phosphoribosyl)-5-[(5-phosphoribosylamino)methylideneamino]imidazole-4-carboxamide isomerase [Acutalibacteraceae bacterium]
MNIFPAIDLIDGKAVRLLKGDYKKKTVYNDDPVNVVKDFKKAGAEFLHLVDLDGAKHGTTDNFNTVKRIVDEGGLFVEIGGGIRNTETVRKYFDIGVDRVIIGTAAVTDPEFLKEAISKYGEKIAVGVDIKDGFVAIKGWLEKSSFTLFDFCKKIQELGVKYLICTDISKDGAMKGTNLDLYKELSSNFNMNITASGGVSSVEDVKNLRKLDLYGAIIGKAYYTGAVNLSEAIAVAK